MDIEYLCVKTGNLSYLRLLGPTGEIFFRCRYIAIFILNRGELPLVLLSTAIVELLVQLFYIRRIWICKVYFTYFISIIIAQLRLSK